MKEGISRFKVQSSKLDGGSTESRPTLTNNIGWCDATANAVIGCAKVSEGCKNCYAANDTPARVLRSGKWPGANGRRVETWGAAGERWPTKSLAEKARALNKRCICDVCRQTQMWRKVQSSKFKVQGNGQESIANGPALPAVCLNCGAAGTMRRIRLFANSNSDWLDEKWPIATFAGLLRLIYECPNVDFQLLTKRPENFLKRMEEVSSKLKVQSSMEMANGQDAQWLAWMEGWRDGHSSQLSKEEIIAGGPRPPHNVWLGASVENQKCADERIPALHKIPAAVRFLSCEPLLGPVDLTRVQFPKMHGGTGPENCLVDPICDYARECYDVVRNMVVPRVHWVIVGGESGEGARRCDSSWILNLVDQCAAARVPCYVKQFGAVLAREYEVASPAGDDPEEWIPRFKVREFPTPESRRSLAPPTTTI